MIRRYEDRDLTHITKIWLDAHIRSHKFISMDLWRSGTDTVKQIIDNNDVYVSIRHSDVIGFLVMDRDSITEAYAVFGKYFCRTMSELLVYAQSLYEHLTLHAYVTDGEALKAYKHEHFSVIGDGVNPYTNEPELILEWHR